MLLRGMLNFFEGFLMDKLILAEFLVSRLCHDMAGPIGGVSNGLDFIKYDARDETSLAAMRLLKTSSNQLVRRLNFFRMILGNMGYGDDIYADARLVKACDDYFYATKINVNFNGELNLNGRRAKILMCFIYLASTLMLEGGDINVMVKDNKVHLSTEANNIKFENDINEIFLNNKTKIDSRNIHIYHIKILLEGEEFKYNLGKQFEAEFLKG